jgi:hypothetical protein
LVARTFHVVPQRTDSHGDFFDGDDEGVSLIVLNHILESAVEANVSEASVSRFMGDARVEIDVAGETDPRFDSPIPLVLRQELMAEEEL